MMHRMTQSRQPALTPDQAAALLIAARKLLEQCKAARVLAHMRGFDTTGIDEIITETEDLLEACDGR